tara:strand:+ start:66 stop:1817 length:1752 start_codon:yes stop_codon:yes gene_type:complete
MILKSFKSLISLLILLLFISPIQSEDKIDIWKNDNSNIDSSKKNSSKPIDQNSLNKNQTQKALKVEIDNEEIKIEKSIDHNNQEVKIFGIYDPADYNFNLNMWSSTQADDLKASLNRINKIKLSKTSEEILEKVLFSFSYPPNGMSEKEFVKLKVDWLIKNNRTNLIENFLKQNNDFEGKGRLVQYLVDENISQANINEGCKKIKFIDSTIKDPYLEKFKIYCLVLNNKKPQAQLLLDLLREQKQSDKFFDDNINYLLGISEKTTNKINEKNLLNFYLSSITIKDFNYTPSKKTKKEIWKYLNAANLIKIDDINDKERIKDLELAANQGRLDKKIIFDIYKQIPFNLNTLINAKNLYQTLNPSDARSLIYQKYLLSEDIEFKIEYLFLLEELFKKDDLQNIFSKKMIDSFKTIGSDNIPEKYQEAVKRKISSNDKNRIKKVKYNDKILHQSKIIKFYLENEEEKKIQKDIDKIFRKISKNKKYFYSAKDLALVDALIKDGFRIPDNFNKKELSNKYAVPKNLMQLIEKKQNAFLALKIVEIIGEDEPYQLDPETIYFITNLLNEMNLLVIRNKVLISALPQRV